MKEPEDSMEHSSGSSSPHLRAFAPASIGNLAAGFDVLGAAFAPLDGTMLGDALELSPWDKHHLKVCGPYAHRLAIPEKENLVFKALRSLERHIGCSLPPALAVLHKALPVNSGLGSSSASAVAAALAYNAWAGEPLSRRDLLKVAGEAETASAGALHLDNVAPALLGGLRLISPGGLPLELAWPDDLVMILLSPDLELPTRQARAVLPRDLPLPLATAHAQNLACLVLALERADRDLIQECLRDLLAEPYRADLVPGFREVQREAMKAGALGCSLSGAGPAVFAVGSRETAQEILSRMSETWKEMGVLCRAWIGQPGPPAQLSRYAGF